MKMMICLALVLAIAGCATEPQWYDQVHPTPGAADPTTSPSTTELQMQWMNSESTPGDGVPTTREQAMQLLLDTRTFANGPVGYAGALADQIRAFVILRNDPDVPAVFQSLLQRAHPAGQLYALCGLYIVDRPAFDKAVIPFKTDTRPVMTICGCIGGESPVCDLIQSPVHPSDSDLQTNLLTGQFEQVLESYRKQIARGNLAGLAGDPDQPPK